MKFADSIFEFDSFEVTRQVVNSLLLVAVAGTVHFSLVTLWPTTSAKNT
jgi:hypothetical protein